MGLLMLAFIVGIACGVGARPVHRLRLLRRRRSHRAGPHPVPLEIARDVAIAAAAAVLVRWPRSRSSLDQALGLTRAA